MLRPWVSTTDFSIVIAGSITATIDNDPASIARGTVTITAVQSSGTIQVVSRLDGAVLPGTVTINLPDAVAPPPTDASASLTSFPTIKSRAPTYPSAPTSFVSAKRRGPKLPTLSIEFNAVHNDEVEAAVRPLIERIGNTGEVFVCTDPTPDAQRQAVPLAPLVPLASASDQRTQAIDANQRTAHDRQRTA